MIGVQFELLVCDMSKCWSHITARSIEHSSKVRLGQVRPHFVCAALIMTAVYFVCAALIMTSAILNLHTKLLRPLWTTKDEAVLSAD